MDDIVDIVATTTFTGNSASIAVLIWHAYQVYEQR